MSDAIQVVLVTAVAGVAFVAILRPYLRRPEAKKSAPKCANCAASAAPSPVRKPAPAPSTHH
jgi:hypothetical protein